MARGLMGKEAQEPPDMGKWTDHSESGQLRLRGKALIGNVKKGKGGKG